MSDSSRCTFIFYLFLALIESALPLLFSVPDLAFGTLLPALTLLAVVGSSTLNSFSSSSLNTESKGSSTSASDFNAGSLASSYYSMSSP